MEDLIKRLEAVEVGGPALNVAVARAFGWYVPERLYAGWHDPEGNHVGLPPNFTTSLDAALALAERVLEGWLWDVTTITTAVGGLRKPLAAVVRPDQPAGEEIKTWGYASTPALALCIAILRAKQIDTASNPR